MFKETKDGQTHYENDGCGELEHNKPCLVGCAGCSCFRGRGCSHRCNNNYREEKSKVNIRQSDSGKGFLIEIKNKPTGWVCMVTRDELEQIVLCGQIMLKDTKNE